ncbi:S-layer homology domain-containing protein [Clostridium oryzae]|uniref:Endo-1,4-beta-xylanase A n=1 Tax=Clostridium oryzae TaxID=1450648 RepID=A0A1V4IYB6_9CLOT|nr:S-layer homology domain-containing protein [Clostridium oryzae]OPJ65062.1 endo-1,4-beta-xylanase A precursor [Clostridium oryzae]
MIRKKAASIITAALVMATCLGVSYPSKVYAKGNTPRVIEKFNSSMKEQAQKATISEEKALQIVVAAVKDYFNYTVDTDEFSVSFDFSKSGYDGGYAWNLQLTKKEKGSRLNISANIDANTGEVFGIRKYEFKDDGNNSTGTYSKEKAQQKAQDFLNKFFADKAKDCQLLNNTLDIYNSDNYYYDFRRVENGVLCNDNYINIEVDDHTGDIVGFDISWDKNFKLPDTSKVISSDAALAAFKKNMNAELRYMAYNDKYNYNGDSNVQDTKLVYDIADVNGYSVDAKTGKFINVNNGTNTITVTKDLTKAEREAWIKKASTPVYHEKEISDEAAKKVIKKYINTLYGKGYTISNLSYSKGEDNSYFGTDSGIWRAEFYKKSGKSKDYNYFSISIDAKTETILNLSHYNNEDSKVKAKVSLDKAYKEAINLLAKYYPEKMKLIDTKQVYTTIKGDDTGNYYSFSFTRLINGIPYADNSIEVSIDKKDGSVSGFSQNWTKNLRHLPPENIKTKNDAIGIAFTKYTPVLTCSNVKGKYTLNYTLIDKQSGNYYHYIDANTGKFLDNNGYELPEISQDFLNKVKNSEYADALTDLAYMGIIDTSTFDMTKSITKIDFFKMLVNAKGYDTYALSNAAPTLKYKDVESGSASYKYLQLAVYYGFLDNSDGNFNESAPISREDMAVVFMKVLGYTDISNNNNIFKLNASDAASVDSSKLGAVTMADAFGILKESNNTIRPKDNATMVEAAVGIYSILNKIQG